MLDRQMTLEEQVIIGEMRTRRGIMYRYKCVSCGSVTNNNNYTCPVCGGDLIDITYIPCACCGKLTDKIVCVDCVMEIR